MKFLPLLCALGLSLLLAAGCKRPEEVTPPATLLSKEQMATLLLRLHLLEARAENSRLQPDSARALFLSQQRELLWRSRIDPQDSALERSYRYYALHDKDLEDIYKVVIDSLQAIERKQGQPQSQAPH